MPGPECDTRSIDKLHRVVTQEEFRKIIANLNRFCQSEQNRYQTVGELASDLRIAIALSGVHIRKTSDINNAATAEETRKAIEALDPYLLDGPAITPDCCSGLNESFDHFAGLAAGTRSTVEVKLYSDDFTQDTPEGPIYPPKVSLGFDLVHNTLEFQDYSHGKSARFGALTLESAPDNLLGYLKIGAASVVARVRVIESYEDFSAFADL